MPLGPWALDPAREEPGAIPLLLSHLGLLPGIRSREQPTRKFTVKPQVTLSNIPNAYRGSLEKGPAQSRACWMPAYPYSVRPTHPSGPSQAWLPQSVP